ncbi:MAG: GNAT family N-acetyltransferase [Desulfamplus sp.]|nr:GNAT family N-acetyltransferase [Desulfamplus sp.]
MASNKPDIASNTDIASTVDIIFRYEPLSGDVQQIKQLVKSTGFFNDEEIEVAGELVEERIDKGDKSGYYFVFAQKKNLSSAESNGIISHEDLSRSPEKRCPIIFEEEKLLGYGCYGPIPGTLSSHDIYWIAVKPDLHRHGLGRILLERMESLISDSGGTRIYVETSMQPKYVTTRTFYERCGYRLETVLEHFYSPGDGKAIYCKSFSS